MTGVDDSNRQKIVGELKNLKRKTALMQACHGNLAEELDRRERISSVFITLFAAFALFATTVEARTLLDFVSENDLRRAAAACSLLVFLCTLVKLETRWGTSAATHAASLNAFTRFLRQIDMILASLEDKSTEELEKLALRLATEYSNLADVSPNIPSAKFLKLKQKHLQTIAFSRALDENPLQSQRKMRNDIKKASKRVDE